MVKRVPKRLRGSPEPPPTPELRPVPGGTAGVETRAMARRRTRTPGETRQGAGTPQPHGHRAGTSREEVQAAHVRESGATPESALATTSAGPRPRAATKRGGPKGAVPVPAKRGKVTKPPPKKPKPAAAAKERGGPVPVPVPAKRGKVTKPPPKKPAAAAKEALVATPYMRGDEGRPRILFPPTPPQRRGIRKGLRGAPSTSSSEPVSPPEAESTPVSPPVLLPPPPATPPRRAVTPESPPSPDVPPQRVEIAVMVHQSGAGAIAAGPVEAVDVPSRKRPAKTEVPVVPKKKRLVVVRPARAPSPDIQVVVSPPPRPRRGRPARLITPPPQPRVRGGPPSPGGPGGPSDDGGSSPTPPRSPPPPQAVPPPPRHTPESAESTPSPEVPPQRVETAVMIHSGVAEPSRKRPAEPLEGVAKKKRPVVVRPARAPSPDIQVVVSPPRPRRGRPARLITPPPQPRVRGGPPSPGGPGGPSDDGGSSPSPPRGSPPPPPQAVPRPPTPPVPPTPRRGSRERHPPNRWEPPALPVRRQPPRRRIPRINVDGYFTPDENFVEAFPDNIVVSRPTTRQRTREGGAFLCRLAENRMGLKINTNHLYPVHRDFPMNHTKQEFILTRGKIEVTYGWTTATYDGPCTIITVERGTNTFIRAVGGPAALIRIDTVE